MAWTPLATRMASSSFPLVLCGPVLRHVAHDQVTVFVALRESRQVILSVYTGAVGLDRTKIAEGTGRTVALGELLHVAAVTAPVVSPAELTAETTYYYDLDFGAGQENLATPGVLASAGLSNPLALGGADLPTFALPPTNLANVRLVHGSCRKPHAPGRDALPAVADMIEGAGVNASLREFARGRPHQLLLTGDQIYADDVADVLLFMLADAATTLLGPDWEEELPSALLEGPAPTSADLAPGARAQLTLDAGLTSGVPERAYPKSHLVRFGEFCAMYLFTWSPVLWPAAADLPDAATVFGRTPEIDKKAAFDKESGRVKVFTESLGRVRTALANVPSYMIFDDHEVSDDWLMNRRWVAAANATATPKGGALASPLGSRVQQNALAAFAIFQAWGNTPERFGPGAAGEAGRALLTELDKWRGADDPTRAQIASRVGLPTAPLSTNDTVLTRPGGALNWSYRVAPRGAAYEILVLDCRTQRAYPPGADVLPAGLMSEAAVRSQITEVDRDERALTLVVAQTPFIGVAGIEDNQRAASSDAVWEKDVEAFSLNKTGFERVLSALVRRRTRVVVLAGDVHYSFAARLTYAATRPFGASVGVGTSISAVVAQFNSSSLRNQGEETLFSSVRLHDGGYNQGYVIKQLGPRVRRLGWNEAARARLQQGAGTTAVPQAVPVSWDAEPVVANPALFLDTTTPVNAPDWSYRIDFVRGTKPPVAPSPARPRLDVVPADTKAAAAVLKAVHAEYDRQLKSDRGSQIVGVNNVSELRFTVNAEGVPQLARQITWWRVTDREEVAGGAAAAFPITTFEVDLNPDKP